MRSSGVDRSTPKPGCASAALAAFLAASSLLSTVTAVDSNSGRVRTKRSTTPQKERRATQLETWTWSTSQLGGAYRTSSASRSAETPKVSPSSSMRRTWGKGDRVARACRTTLPNAVVAFSPSTRGTVKGEAIVPLVHPSLRPPAEIPTATAER